MGHEINNKHSFLNYHQVSTQSRDFLSESLLAGSKISDIGCSTTSYIDQNYIKSQKNSDILYDRSPPNINDNEKNGRVSYTSTTSYYQHPKCSYNAEPVQKQTTKFALELPQKNALKGSNEFNNWIEKNYQQIASHRSFNNVHHDLSPIPEDVEISKTSSYMTNAQKSKKPVGNHNFPYTSNPNKENIPTEQFRSILEKTKSSEKKVSYHAYPHYNYNYKVGDQSSFSRNDENKSAYKYADENSQTEHNIRKNLFKDDDNNISYRKSSTNERIYSSPSYYSDQIYQSKSPSQQFVKNSPILEKSEFLNEAREKIENPHRNILGIPNQFVYQTSSNHMTNSQNYSVKDFSCGHFIGGQIISSTSNFESIYTRCRDPSFSNTNSSVGPVNINQFTKKSVHGNSYMATPQTDRINMQQDRSDILINHHNSSIQQHQPYQQTQYHDKDTKTLIHKKHNEQNYLDTGISNHSPRQEDNSINIMSYKDTFSGNSVRHSPRNYQKIENQNFEVKKIESFHSCITKSNNNETVDNNADDYTPCSNDNQQLLNSYRTVNSTTTRN